MTCQRWLSTLSLTSAGAGVPGPLPPQQYHGDERADGRIWDSTAGYGGGWLRPEVFELRRKEREVGRG